MAEVIKRQEVQVTPEIIKFGQLLGIQGRFILADQKYLNPDIDVPLIDAVNPTATFDQRNYNPFENTSRFDRRDYWQKQVAENKASADFDNQLGAWKSSMVTLFKSDRSKNKIEKLKPFFSQIAINVENFDGGAANTLYSRYFQNGASSVKLFVEDIIKTYDNVQDLKNNLTEIQWLAHMFGEKSSEIVSQLIDAEVNFLTDTQFTEKLNQKTKEKTPLNDLSEKEIELLSHIITHGNGETVKKGEEKKERGPLPIMKHEAEIKGYLSDPNIDNIIVSAGTGTGKTTKIPVFAMYVMDENQKMIVTQPRRLPTEEVSMTIKETEGEKVGYVHGKGKELNPDEWQVAFMTEGTLKRRMVRDPLLLEIDKIMFDEVHEMNVDLQMDMALALEIQKKRKEMIAQGITQHKGKPVRPLQLIFASATSNEEALKRFVPGAEFVKVKGETAKINDFFEKEEHEIPLDQKPALAAEKVKWLIDERHKEKGRTFIIFMPGDRLIRETANKLRELKLPDLEIKPLIGYMPREEQKETIKPNPDKYNVIIATPIAETSITIRGGVDVISSGLVNEAKIDENTGLSRLVQQLHSVKGMFQQKGRGGRTGESDFIFLGTKREFEQGIDGESRLEFTANPITQCDLTSQILFVKAMGKNIEDLRFMEPPNQKNVQRAIRQLTNIGALSPDGTITDIGKKMDKVPVDPHLARMIIEAQEQGCGEAACTIVAMIELNPTLFVRPEDDAMSAKINRVKGEFQKDKSSDFINLLNLWREYFHQPESERKNWIKEHYLRESTLEQVGARRKELMKRLDITGEESSTDNIARCIFAGFKDKVLRKNSSGRGKVTYSLQYEPVSNAAIDKNSVLYNKSPEAFIAFSNYSRQRDHTYEYMIINQEIDPSWL